MNLLKIREETWNQLLAWLKASEVDAWEVSSMVKDFCQKNDRKFPVGAEDPFAPLDADLCPGCGGPSPAGDLCDECFDAQREDLEPTCPICNSHSDGICDECEEGLRLDQQEEERIEAEWNEKELM